ncbi:MAG: LCP family protein, partial [Candidatus Electryonea clarkiae]|nr:LCP family protein [Candidatus Electryonea clarkiae]
NLKILKTIVFSLAGITILIGGAYLLFSWNKPLNPALSLPTEVNGSETPDLSESDGEASVTPSPTEEPVCGAPPTLHILVSGVASSSYLYGLADAIRVARIDFQTKEVSVLAFPRDLWVEIPGLESRGIEVGKLNQAYFYGTEGMGYFSGTGYGSGLLAETLMLNYGYRVDRYLAVNLNSFRMIIDTLGGIDVYLGQDVYKKVNEQPELFLSAGSHHLNGKEAEILARQRINIGDFGRINNQTVILKAVAVKMLSPSGISALPALIEQLRFNVQTDLSPADISQLICLGGMLDFGEDINFITLPDSLMVEDMIYDPTRGVNTAVLVGDNEKISELLMEFQQRNWP